MLDKTAKFQPCSSPKSPELSKLSITRGGRFELDHVIANWEIIRKFCLENKSEENEMILKNFGEFPQTVSFVQKIAPEFFLDGGHDVKDNGFVTYD